MKIKSKQPRQRTTTTESFAEEDSKETLVKKPYDASSESSVDFEVRQVYKDCGTAPLPVTLKNKGKLISPKYIFRIC